MSENKELLKDVLMGEFLAGANLGRQQGAQLIQLALNKVLKENNNIPLTFDIVMVVVNTCVEELKLINSVEV